MSDFETKIEKITTAYFNGNQKDAIQRLLSLPQEEWLRVPQALQDSKALASCMARFGEVESMKLALPKKFNNTTHDVQFDSVMRRTMNALEDDRPVRAFEILSMGARSNHNRLIRRTLALVHKIVEKDGFAGLENLLQEADSGLYND